MITLDDVRRIKEILIAHGEWTEYDMKRSRFDDDGTFVWITASCDSSTIVDLVKAGFDVYAFGSLSHLGCIQFNIR